MREDSWSLLLSSIVHVTAIAALGFVLCPLASPPDAPAIQTVWNELPGEAPTVVSEVIEVQAPASPDAGGRSSPVVDFNAARAPAILSSIGMDASPERGPLVAALDLNERVRLSAGPARGAGEGTGTGFGNGSGPGRGGGVEFFPLKQQGGRYIFVVDASKSMNHPWHGPAKSRLGRVKVELWRTIFRMSTEQQFFIIFFDTRARPMPAAEFRAGGTENQQSLFDWTAKVRADGRTDPYDALLMAVRMQPDVIYFLTDGEFNYKVVREVTKANFGGINIHTISLGNEDGERFLQEIAQKNNGTYRHIAEEEDRYWEEPPVEISSAPITETATGP